jgi:SAM-dependent methyltransferase
LNPVTTSLYDALAPIYDEWQAWNGMTPFARVAAAKLEPLLRREAREKADPFAHLDLGCGTATLLVALHAAQPAWRLAGMDGSAGMLAAARAKPDARGIVLVRGTLAAPLPFARAFDSCSILYDTINHLTEPEAIVRLFQFVAAVLKPGGLLIFDVTNRLGFERWWAARARFSGEGWAMSIAANFDPDSDVAIADVSITRAGCDGLFQLRERYHGEDDLRAAVVAAGFRVERARRWAPFPRREAGKTLWMARLAGPT